MPRRPDCRPDIEWCCRCCREVSQLQWFMAVGPTMNADPVQVSAVGVIHSRMAMVDRGLYGGVELQNLFD